MIHRIAITPGEPAGIGPDICALLSKEPPENTELVVISDAEILKERAVELYMEGHRFFDLTRFGVYDEYCRFVYGDTDGARQAEDYTWPIPIIETSSNSEID